MSNTVKTPPNLVLALLERGLKDGSIKPKDVMKLLPHGSFVVDPDIRRRARELSDLHGLRTDGLYYRAQKTGCRNLSLYLYGPDHKSAARGLGEKFHGMEDIDAAAERLLESYLQRLVG